MMNSIRSYFAGGAVVVCAWAVVAIRGATAPAEPQSPSIDFVGQIRPIFATHCYQCHDAAKHKGGLRLDNRNEAMLGGDNGADIIARDADHSRLLHLVRGDDPDAVMPAKGARLSPAEIEILAHWIKQGAIWPDSAAVSGQVAPTHWSFIRPRPPEIPHSQKHQPWIRNPIDAFVLAKLEENGLEPSAEADRYTLIRRASLDLIGLPPTPHEVEAFVNDSRPEAYEQLIDRLLANPHFGERWARMWLDVARFADSAGYGSDPLRKTIYRYRDWVIEAFNRNLPYDQFTIDQIAGDLLPNPTTDQLIATAFNRNTMTNTEGGTDAEEFRVAAVKDRVDTTVQAWMGLTSGAPVPQPQIRSRSPTVNTTSSLRSSIRPKTTTAATKGRPFPRQVWSSSGSIRKSTRESAQAEREMADPAQNRRWRGRLGKIARCGSRDKLGRASSVAAHLVRRSHAELSSRRIDSRFRYEKRSRIPIRLRPLPIFAESPRFAWKRCRMLRSPPAARARRRRQFCRHRFPRHGSRARECQHSRQVCPR